MGGKIVGEEAMSRPRTRAIKTLVCLICGEPLSAQQIYDESSTHGACYRERQREEKAAKAAASDGSPIDRRRVRFRRDEGIPDRPGKPVSSITGWPTAKFAGILSPLAKCPWGRACVVKSRRRGAFQEIARILRSLLGIVRGRVRDAGRGPFGESDGPPISRGAMAGYFQRCGNLLREGLPRFAPGDMLLVGH